MLVEKWSLGLAIATCLIAAVSLGCGGGQGGGTAGPASAPSAKPAAEPAAESEPAAATPTTSGSASSGAAAEGWGHLTGRFVFDGPAPPQNQVNVTKDQEFCTRKHPLDESLVVNSASGGLRDVLVWLYLGRSGKAPDPHPSYAETAETQVRLDNEWCRFEPHITLLRTSQTLVIGNKDEVGHNTKCDPLDNPGFNVTVPTNQDITQKFAKAERLPADVNCNIHPWMIGHLLIQDHPYMAASNEEGQFEIKNLPAGKWTFQVWHAKSGYVDNVSLGGKSTAWSRGRFEFEIQAGDNDLGEIKIKPEVFSN